MVHSSLGTVNPIRHMAGHNYLALHNNNGQINHTYFILEQPFSVVCVREWQMKRLLPILL